MLGRSPDRDRVRAAPSVGRRDIRVVAFGPTACVFGQGCRGSGATGGPGAWASDFCSGRLRVLPRLARPVGLAAPGRRPGARFAVRDISRAEHLTGPECRDWPLADDRPRQRADERRRALGPASLPRSALYELRPHECRRRARPHGVLADASAVSTRPPPHELSFPFTIRRAIGLWKLLFFDRAPLEVDPAHDANWNRGRYLVEALGHCAECHSSRNIFGAVRPATRFAGGPDQSGIGYIPNITPDHLGRWSVGDIAGMLSTGYTPDLRFVGSSMAGVVTNTAELPDADRAAIATYIKSLPARPTPPPS